MQHTTAPTPSAFTGTLHKGEELLSQLIEALRESNEQTRKTKRHYQQWRAQPKPQAFLRDQQSAAGGMLESVLTEMVLGSLFGMPMFISLSSAMVDGLHGAALTSMVGRGAQEESPHAELQEFMLDAETEEEYAAMCAQALAAQQAQQQEMSRQKKLLLMALVTLLMQPDTAKPRENVVPDVLRHPARARFKQNRHSIDCIRSAFSRQADSVLAPRFSAPKYRMAG